MDGETLGNLDKLEPVRSGIVCCIFDIIRTGLAGRVEFVQFGQGLFALL